MRVVICDVCESQLPEDTETLTVVIPNSWTLGAEAEEGAFQVDICTPQCLAHLARQLGPSEEMAGETADQGDDRDTSAGQFVPVEAERPTFVSPVKVKTRSEHD